MSEAPRPRRVAPRDRLLIIGLIGRTGSGKSTAARALAESGATVIEGDRLGHEITDRDPEVREALAAEFGHQIYLADGTLDRRRVAARVFSDPETRLRFDRLIHPRIIARIRREIDSLREQGAAGWVVIDAALLLEWGLERWCDVVLAVTAPEEDQIARLSRARGWDGEEAMRRLSVQRSNESFAQAADLALENDGTKESLAQAALQAVRRIAERHAERVPRHGKKTC